MNRTTGDFRIPHHDRAVLVGVGPKGLPAAKRAEIERPGGRRPAEGMERGEESAVLIADGAQTIATQVSATAAGSW